MVCIFVFAMDPTGAEVKRCHFLLFLHKGTCILQVPVKIFEYYAVRFETCDLGVSLRPQNNLKLRGPKSQR